MARLSTVFVRCEAIGKYPFGDSYCEAVLDIGRDAHPDS